MSLSEAAIAVVQSALEELKQAKQARPTHTSIKAAVDGAIIGLDLDSKWQLEQHADRLVAGIETLLAGEHQLPAGAAATSVLGEAPMITTHSPLILQVHLAASSASADSAVGLACLLATSAAAAGDLHHAASAASAATACLAHPSVWKNSAAARTPLLEVAATCLGRLQSALLSSITGQSALGAQPAAVASVKKGKRVKRTRTNEEGGGLVDPAAAQVAAETVVATLQAALAAAAAAQSSHSSKPSSLAPTRAATAAVQKQHDVALAAVLASLVLLHFLAAAAQVAAAGDGNAKRARTVSGAPISTQPSAPVPPVALLAGGLSCASASRVAVVSAVAEAVAAAGAATTGDTRFKALQHSRGYIAHALWQCAVLPLLEAQAEAAAGGAQVRVTPWAHVRGGQASAAWTGPEWASLVLAARGILRLTYHVSKAARKAHVGGGVGGGLLLLPSGGQGATTNVGALEKTVTCALVELSTPGALSSWCKGALLAMRVDEGVDGGAVETSENDAIDEVAHPSCEDGPMLRLLNRKKVSDAAVRKLVHLSGDALGADAAGQAGTAAGASQSGAADDGDDAAAAATAAAAVEGLAADADLFMVDTEGAEE